MPPQIEHPLCIFVDFNGTLDTVQDGNAFFDQFATSLKKQGITKPIEFYIISKGAGIEQIEDYIQHHNLKQRIHGYLTETRMQRFDAESPIDFHNGKDVVTTYMRIPPENTFLIDNDRVCFQESKEGPANVKPLQIGCLEKVVMGMDMEEALREFSETQFSQFKKDQDRNELFEDVGSKLLKLGHGSASRSGPAITPSRSLAAGTSKDHTTSPSDPAPRTPKI